MWIDAGLWGKSKGLPMPYPLLWHLMDTAAVAGVLWSRYLAPNQRRIIAEGLAVDEGHARSLIMFWAGLHDVGKASPSFQKQDERAFAALRRGGSYEDVSGDCWLGHDIAGQLALPELLGAFGYPQLGRRASSRVAYRVAQIAGGHHGRFQQSSGPHGGRLQLGGGAWARQREALVGVVYGAVGSPQPPAAVDAAACVLVTGLVILADWLASQEHFLREQLSRVPRSMTVESAAAYLSALAGPATALVDEAGLVAPSYRAAGFEDLFPHPPNALQRSLIDELLPVVNGPGLLVVTAATGDGKTEAGLVTARRLAEVCGASGFFFALPTMATSDEMYRRVRKFAVKLADGPAPVTLLHSMSWLNAEYEARAVAGVGEHVGVLSDDPARDVVAPDWLRGRKRGLLAPMAVGTVDQALLAALTTKHNALRLLGLSGKVFIVDEAHAYDEYMTALLRRLMSWLGRYGCPVVLLSATLPSSQASALVQAYQEGAGAEPTQVSVPYPGWMFVPAMDRGAVTISPASRERVVAGRRMRFQLDVRPVRHLSGPEVDPMDRRAVVRQVLAPVVQGGGCAAVVCNTVNDAQQTYRLVRDWAPAGVDVLLLHSRFPARRREEITAEITGRLGRDGDRSVPVIVVATQVIEQSLDLDLDLLVTDLAPMAQLLQRAGRCQRHRRTRPSWAERPRVVVLDPRGGTSGDEHVRPPAWGDVYARYLLRATHLRLAGIDSIAVPQSVQEHVEAVYVPGLISDDPVLGAEYDEYRAQGMAVRGAAELGVIPDPAEVADLAVLSHNDTPEWLATTRLGADSDRVLCCYLDADGQQWLDPNRRTPLPQRGSGAGGRFRQSEVRAILQETLPVRAGLLKGYDPPRDLPASWGDNSWLKDLRPLWLPLQAAGPEPAVWGGRMARLDHELGLEVLSTGGAS
ncbi:CRISPR-associated helicase Cas3' [Micromonospora sp. NPDC092111]|uniref:CRISPR-associated helicase Cas3' n=1 Tax=Micromonospora sp. NPDC092111 TaxID=3364289 RepID=UPI0038183806